MTAEMSPPPEPEPEVTLRRARGLDEDDQPRALWERAIGWAIVAIATWLVWNVLDAHHHWSLLPWRIRFGDLFLNTTTNGGDMGAHVWWPHFLEQHWFIKGRLSGWAPDWYAGFPVGQYYFPLPAVAIAVLDHVPFVPYNVAFKLVTVSGPLMLPAAAYYFARGMRAPWPAPPAFALAALGMLMQTRTDWQIYGGNIASTLAGEFSFTIGLALALFGLGALAHTLDTGKRRWLPAVLIAAAIMSHIVVGIFIIIAASLLWLTRRPWRTWFNFVSVSAVAVLLTGVWLLPLIGNRAFTQSMRYGKVVPQKVHTLTHIRPLDTFISAMEHAIDPNTHKHATTLLWVPGWMLILACVAIVAAGWYRRRSTLVLLVLTLVMGFLFVEWPADFAIWNTRFLPFWLLSFGFLAAMGATEILRLIAMLVARAYRWIREGDLQDARARAWAELATADDDPTVDPVLRKDAAWALAERRFDKDPQGWSPPVHLSPSNIEYHTRFVGTVALAIIVGLSGLLVLRQGWNARNGNPSIAISGWAQWNYSGYERKQDYPQYKAVIDGMDQISKDPQYGPGRALWEPSSGDQDAINNYGTSLALELLPYFTDGRIGSMEGIYFESSATTDYHFLTVAQCSDFPSNPVRGLKYGTVENDFDLCVKHLQMLGVRYLMLWTDKANAKAAASPDLTLIKTIPQNPSIPAPEKTQLSNWKVYEVAYSDLVVPMTYEPVVATGMKGGKYSQCWGEPSPDSSQAEPKLNDPWECTVAPWWDNRAALDVQFTANGPKEWQRVPATDLATVHPAPITPTEVTNVRRGVDKIQFHVSDIGKPVLVRESYFPNWHVKGAKGPYRIAPNLMVVVPTSNDVTLTYGVTPVDWLGRLATLLGIAGIVFLAVWKGGSEYAGDPTTLEGERGEDEDDDDSDGDDDPDDAGGEPDPPPRRWAPAPALP
jgi:hypothetical protein